MKASEVMASLRTAKSWMEEVTAGKIHVLEAFSKAQTEAVEKALAANLDEKLEEIKALLGAGKPKGSAKP